MCSDEPDGQPSFAPLSLTDKPLFDSAMRNLAQPISDYTFANVFIWSTCLRLSWTTRHRHLCVFANGDDLTMLLPPLPLAGATEAEMRQAVHEAFGIMDAYNLSCGHADRSRMEYVSDEMLERLHGALGDSLNLGATPMSGDFIYPRMNMVELAGKALKSKRHGKTRFMREYPDHRTELLTATHVDACLTLLDRWEQHADDAHPDQITEDESHTATAILRRREEMACRTALHHHETLGLTGMVLYVGETLVGFTLGEAVSPNQASVLIEKTDPRCHGAPQFIYSEFCRVHWDGHPEINAGDDWGIPTLRWTKESYRPSRRLNKYALVRPSTVPTPLVLQSATPEARPQPVDFVTPLMLVDPTPAPFGGGCAAQLEARSRAGGGSREDLRDIVCSNEGEPPVVIRPATLADLNQLQIIEQRCFAPDHAFSRRQIRSLIVNPHVMCAVAAEGDAVLGWVVTMMRQHRHRRSGRVYNLAIHPDHRKRRLGQSLLDHAIGQLKANGVQRVYIEVATTNQRAQALYENTGFRLVRILRDYYHNGEHGLSMCLPVGHTTPDPDPAPNLWEPISV